MTAMRDDPYSYGPGAPTGRRPGSDPAGTSGAAARSRAGGIWVALIVAAFVLLLLLIFILQNGHQTRVSFLGAHINLPMGVAMLLAAVFGALLVALPGTIRILQLRAFGRRATGSKVTGSTGTNPTPDDR